jgi:serine O-acetyltransferase
MAKRDIYTRLVYARQNPVFGKMAYYLLKLLGVEIPRSVKIGRNLTIEHGGYGVVIHSKSVIGNNVRIYPGVTLGRADIHKPADQSSFKGIQIEDDVILASGAKILCKQGTLIVARGSMVGANAVLLGSTAENEIWAGMPARCIGKRNNS